MEAVASRGAYSPPKAKGRVDLFLDANEGRCAPSDVFEGISAEVARRYPDQRELCGIIARRLGVAPERVLVTAGGDDAIDRACRSVLAPGRTLLTTAPTFEMFERYAALAGAGFEAEAWTEGTFPTARVAGRVKAETGAIAVVTPNNPTGLVARAEDLMELSRAAPHALLIVDLAYTEFADRDLTEVALGLPNAVVIRTLSKAWGLAGVRVGYAVGPKEVIGWMRAAGGPYAVSAVSLEIARRRLAIGDDGVRRFVDRIRFERGQLKKVLVSSGATALDSQANFVFARAENAAGARDRFAEKGIAVRAFAGRPGLEDALRITCPGNERDFERLVEAARQAFE